MWERIVRWVNLAALMTTGQARAEGPSRERHGRRREFHASGHLHHRRSGRRPICGLQSFPERFQRRGSTRRAKGIGAPSGPGRLPWRNRCSELPGAVSSSERRDRRRPTPRRRPGDGGNCCDRSDGTGRRTDRRVDDLSATGYPGHIPHSRIRAHPRIPAILSKGLRRPFASPPNDD
jgi:hypothetical protein